MLYGAILEKRITLVFGSPSPDRSGILFLALLARKRYSGQQEIAPKK